MRVWGLVVLVAFVACDKDRSSDSDKPPGAKAKEAPAPPEPDPVEALFGRIDNAQSLSAAVEIVRPFMSDTYNESSNGALLLSYWASEAIEWQEVADSDQTSIARIMKDSDAERGKRMCVRGKLVEISKLELDKGRKVFDGLMLLSRGDIVRFYAARDTGDLVARSRSTFCGVVTGRFDYANSAGGTGHAVSVVGMFDPSKLKK